MGKEAILKSNGWYNYYSETHLVHPNIFEFFDKTGIHHWSRFEHTNYQMSINEAWKIYLKCQKTNKNDIRRKKK